MMKRLLIILFIVGISGTTGVLHAQFDKGDVLLSAGASFGNLWYYNNIWVWSGDYSQNYIPPLVAKLEVGVHEYLGIGLFGGYYSKKFTYKTNHSYSQEYTFLSAGFTGCFHFTKILADNLDIGDLDELDMYFITTPRLEFINYSSSYHYDLISNSYTTYSASDTKIRVGAGLGFRFYIADNLGIFAELGSCNLGYLTLGGTLKF